MLREQLLKKGLRSDKDFRWRGEEVSRLEGLSDAVFAFAVTLLVVSLEVPRAFPDLLQTMKGFVAFGICFTMLIFIWHNHYIFFRRYGLQNLYIITLNAVLLFVVLFYIYPLKFLFTYLANVLLGMNQDASNLIRIESQQTPTLMVIYSMGFFTIFFVFFLFYLYAYQKRQVLQLNVVEIALTRFSMQAQIIYLSIALLSIVIVAIGGASSSAWAGLIYALIGPARTVHGIVFGRQLKKMQAVS
ncbi:MAG: TMEM175 family protein [bacterium]